MPEDANNQTPQDPIVPLPQPTPSIVSPPPAPQEPQDPVNPVVAPVPQQVVTSPKKGKRGLLWAIVALVIVVLLGGGSALAYNFWYQNPNKVVSDALLHAVTAKTVSMTGTLDMSTKDYKVKLEVSGKNSLEANSQVAVKLHYEAGDVKIDVNGEGVFSAEGDIYVKVNDARELVDSIEKQSGEQVSFKMFDGVINKIDGKWVKIAKSDLGDVNKEYEKTQQCLADVSKQLDKDASFRNAVEKETKEIYTQHPFVKVGDKIGTRTINGEGSLGYKLTGDKQVAKDFAKKFGDSQLGKKFKDCNKDLDFESLVDTEEKSDSKTKTDVEIWVSRFGHNITELNIRGTGEDDEKGSIVITPTFNKKEKVEIPSNAIPFSDVKKDTEKAYEDYYQSYYMSDDNYQSPVSGEFN